MNKHRAGADEQQGQAHGCPHRLTSDPPISHLEQRCEDGRDPTQRPVHAAAQAWDRSLFPSLKRARLCGWTWQRGHRQAGAEAPSGFLTPRPHSLQAHGNATALKGLHEAGRVRSDQGRGPGPSSPAGLSVPTWRAWGSDAHTQHTPATHTAGLTSVPPHAAPLGLLPYPHGCSAKPWPGLGDALTTSARALGPGGGFF